MNIEYDANVAAIEVATQLGNDRQETIDRLDALTTLDWIVNAEPMVAINGIPVFTWTRCTNDWDHGGGTVLIPGQDLLCPDCAERILRAELLTDTRIDVEVLLFDGRLLSDNTGGEPQP